MAELKMPKCYRCQVRGLIEDHHLLVTDTSKAMELLSSVNYYRLSAYGIGLKSAENPEFYEDGITLEHIFRLYQFDSCLRNLMTPILEWIEVEFRTRLAYHLALAYGAEGYRDETHFSAKAMMSGMKIHTYTIQKLDDEIKRQQLLPCVRHHLTKYDGHFPVWVASELFTFGMACSLYDVCLSADKQAIADTYHTKPWFLYSWMLSLSELRNKCAHYNRVYNIPFTKTPALYTEEKQFSGNKLFPLLLVMKHLVGERQLWPDFTKALISLMRDYPEAVPENMGFPDHWVDLLTATEETA